MHPNEMVAFNSEQRSA